MVILAIYYTIADIVLLAQCFYYRGFTLSDDVHAPVEPEPESVSAAARKPGRSNNRGAPNERTALLTNTAAVAETSPFSNLDSRGGLGERRGSWTHLSPAVPLIDELPEPAAPRAPPTRLQTLGFNSLAVLMVCLAGVAGWWLSRGYGQDGGDGSAPGDEGKDSLEMDYWGQIFGWLCAVLYLGSRLPQLLLNWRRKSTEGVSVLFFLFACLGNLTYVLSILAHDTQCEGEDGCRDGEAARLYWRYILVNLSWLAGSAGTLFLDMSIFVQFFLYSKSEGDEESDDFSDEEEEESIDGDRWDQRPVLERNSSDI